MATCLVTGIVAQADGSPCEDATVTWDSVVTQVVNGQPVQPVIVSTSTDHSGNLQAISLVQGLVMQQRVTTIGVTYPPTTVIVPFLESCAFSQLQTLTSSGSPGGGAGIPEAPNYNGPWARQNNTWVATVASPNIAGGASNFAPLNGVTDASAGAAGVIGECVEAASSAFVPVPISLLGGTTTYVTLVSMSLSSGDWDVGGDVAWESTAATVATTVLAQCTLSTVAPPAAPNFGYGMWAPLPNDFKGAAGAIATRRLNATVTTTVYAVGQIASPNASDVGTTGTQGACYLHARRQR